jgi:glutamyl-tRNA synthetase
VAVTQANVVLPAEIEPWLAVVFGELPPPDAEGAALIGAAGPEFFAAAAAAVRMHGTDWKAITQAVREATGRKGPELFKPLRYALTGQGHGPELAPLLNLMGAPRALQRLERLAAA